MTEEYIQRRLAAILATDVVGYSKLMEKDEVGTLAALRGRRKEILEPIVAKHRGRIFKITGDGALMEFGSAVNAVRCAVDVQEAMAAANIDQPDKCIVLRIGIHLGDVMVEGSDLYGDGVNIAARLEGIAEPGRIYISEDAYRQVRNKIPLAFEELGRQILKNIDEPMQVYAIAAPRSESSATLPLPDKPSIAILPFTNMSGDPAQEYFSDGITEDIITELSRFRSLFVIARNSSFTYKGRSVKIGDVGRELGVAFVVEGSVRRLGNRVRITVQLIYATTGNHVWAERYDRDVVDLFEVQDDVVKSIVGTIEGRLASAVAERAGAKSKASIAAYELVLQARQHLGNYDVEAAEPLLRNALKIDPGYAQAYAWLAMVYWIKFFDDQRPETIEEAVAFAREAVSLDNSDSLCQAQLGFAYLFQRQFEKADIHSKRALEINPADMSALSIRAHWLCRTGRAQEAIETLDEVLKHEPFPPSWYWENRSIALMTMGKFADAISAILQKSQLFWWDHCYLAACHAHLGRLTQAREEIAETMRKRPTASIGTLMKGEPYENPEDAQILIDGMRMAGLRD